MPASPRVLEALRGRYEIDREIGHGGMATVYLAQDVRDQRQVAIKVMHPRVANALNAQRFLREIAIAGSMGHPLIVPLHDSGAVDDVLF
jgi:eukaryotic-like serine/threonine-protein kinase